MVKILLKQLGEYKRDTLLTPIFVALDVLMELMIPFTIASLIDKGIEAGNMKMVSYYGVKMLVLALLSLVFGCLAGKCIASASTGFACNLREAMYENIQKFSFSNIDKYSTAGLVTRMTTDVTNVQNAFQMALRIVVRSPLVLIFSISMCYIINKK